MHKYNTKRRKCTTAHTTQTEQNIYVTTRLCTTCNACQRSILKFDASIRTLCDVRIWPRLSDIRKTFPRFARSSITMISMEHMWNNNDKRKPKFSEKNCTLPTAYFTHTARDQTRVSAVTGKRLTAWVTERPLKDRNSSEYLPIQFLPQRHRNAEALKR